MLILSSCRVFSKTRRVFSELSCTVYFRYNAVFLVLCSS